MCCSVLPPEIVMHDAYIGGHKSPVKPVTWQKTCNYIWVVRFFHPRSSCTTTHISADVQRITLNVSCMTISGGRTKQLDIFCCITGFTSDFSEFHSRGTYSVLSRSPSVISQFFVVKYIIRMTMETDSWPVMCHLRYYCQGLSCSAVSVILSCPWFCCYFLYSCFLCCSLWQLFTLRYFVFVRVLSSVVTLGWSGLVVSTSASDWLERLVSETIYNVTMWM